MTDVMQRPIGGPPLITAGALSVLERFDRIRQDLSNRYPEASSLKIRSRALLVRSWLHILPGQSILLFGGGAPFAGQLNCVLEGRNPITLLHFGNAPLAMVDGGVQFLDPKTAEDASLREAFDYVIGLEVVGRENYPEAISTMWRCLRSGGRLLLFVPKARKPFENIKDAEIIEDLRNLQAEDFYIIPYDILPDSWPVSVLRQTRSKLLVLEHIPFIRNFCNTACVWARKSGGTAEIPVANMAEHPNLFNAVSVVVPCHNEEMNVRGLVRGLMGMFGDYIHEIILVNDNSRDGTAEVSAALAQEDSRIRCLNRKPPNGVGRALRDGYAAATGGYILSMDCDFVHLLPEFRGLFDAVAAGYDGAIGSRFSHDSVVVNYPVMKIVSNRLLHLLIKPVVPKTIRDLSNNLKLYRAGILKTLNIEEPHFAANLETGLKPVLAGYNIKEVPVSWVNRSPDMGSSSFKLLKVGPPYARVVGRAIRDRIRKAWLGR
jgi:dolichol-phosphate mannosyltransferase